ncbi:ABC-type branched-subunit amino acid transport system substrate-binding protein [Halarchaeum rubridurum]|uniref:ABC-type branched-subunit amino acid transport system substrate-binding protein n=2 Tax=Halarchaeum rubridurum TaxID=489911 RepID=A0A8T4GPW6_9EURY|nr:ABC transporter substrate-binding protein [Halarchaeum rubridurum]MBP1954592.1 ABC-type branched-subunit amino acid transport system substrate-binding protein [Halarchaeum rubridurum]
MPKITRRRALEGLGAAGIAGLAGCSSGPGGEGSGSGGTTTGSTGPMEITLGLFTPNSGAFAPWGPSLETGTRLAIQDLENELDVSVGLEVYDTKTDPSGALDAMKRAVTADGIDFAQGGINSSVCTKIGTWASDNNVSYIGQGASDSLRGEACQPFMYMVYQTNHMMATTIGREMADTTDNWYVLYADYVWGHNAEQVVTSAVEENGATVVGKDATPFPNDDYTQYINNVANSDADGVALLIPGPDASRAVKQMRNQGLTDITIGAQMLEDMVFWGLDHEAAAMVDIASMGWVNTIDGVGDFNDRVAEAGELDPFVRHAKSYTSADQHVRAAVRAGSTRAEDIREELEGHEVQSAAKDIHGGGEMYWRACDHELVSPVFSATAREASAMQDDPYKQWFDVTDTTPGDDVVRSCEETGCTL